MGNDVQNKPRITELLKSYKGALVLLIFLALTANVLSLALPKVISHAINTFVKGDFVYQTTVMYFVLFGAGVFIFTVLQNIVQTYVSEKVARDVRTRLSVKISNESYLFVEKANPSKLLTYLTSDVDSIKLFVDDKKYDTFYITHDLYGKSLNLTLQEQKDKIKSLVKNHI